MTARNDDAAREIATTRVLGAPRHLVFRAWTDPGHIVHWWGPRGFTTTITEMDVRPGGHWRFVMHGPDGTDYQNHIIYSEVVEPERLVYDHVSGPKFRMVATFADEPGGGTRLSVRMVFESAAERDRVAQQFGAVEGLHQTLVRLAERLPSAPGADDGRPFTLTRTFDAPRELVFRAWTERDHLLHWWGPKGFTVVRCELDLRAGGTFHYCIRSPEGREMWGRWVFREVTPPERLVMVASFSDERGGLARHPLAPDWPAEMLTTLTLTEQQGGQTRLDLVYVPIHATEVELRTFEGGRESLRKGWGGTLEQFAEYLAKR